MDARDPITIVLGRFEDLIGRGLRSLIAEDQNIELLAADVELDALDATLAEHEPKVTIINFGSLRTPVEVHRLHSGHPETRLLVLASRPTPKKFSVCGSLRSRRPRPTTVSLRPAHSSGVGASATTRFGKALSASSARRRSAAWSNVARTATEWPTTTGTRTQVGVTSRP